MFLEIAVGVSSIGGIDEVRKWKAEILIKIVVNYLSVPFLIFKNISTFFQLFFLPRENPVAKEGANATKKEQWYSQKEPAEMRGTIKANNGDHVSLKSITN